MAAPTTAQVEGWLAELELGPGDRLERESVASLNLRLDGRRRLDVRVTVILDPATATFVRVHLAPPIADAFRVSYRRLLRWNDEFPFAKSALSDDRPILAVEIPVNRMDRDELGLAIACPHDLRPPPRRRRRVGLDRRPDSRLDRPGQLPGRPLERRADAPGALAGPR